MSPIRFRNRLYHLRAGRGAAVGVAVKDPRLAMAQAMVDRTMIFCSPVERVVAAVFVDAKTAPGSLLKVTCRNGEEAIEALTCAIVLAGAVGIQDLTKLDSVTSEGWPIVELTNGSGIVIAQEEGK